MMQETNVPDSVVMLTEMELTARRHRRHARLREQSDGDTLTSCYSVPRIEETEYAACNNSEGISKRREANARERLRVRNLNSGFAKLRRILPTVPPNRKPSKVDTLQSAIDYIHQLEQLLQATGGIPDIGTRTPGPGHSHSRQSVTECPFFPLSDFGRRSSVLSDDRYNTSCLRFNHAVETEASNSNQPHSTVSISNEVPAFCDNKSTESNEAARNKLHEQANPSRTFTVGKQRNFESHREVEQVTQEYLPNMDVISGWKGCGTVAYTREMHSLSIYGMFEETLSDRQMNCV